MQTVALGVSMKDLFTEEQLSMLTENGLVNYGSVDIVPVAHLRSIKSNWQWLVTQINPNDSNEAFGLIDENQQEPRIGVINLSDLMEIANRDTDLFNNIGFHTEYRLVVFQELAKELKVIAASEDGLEEDFKRIDMKLRNQ